MKDCCSRYVLCPCWHIGKQFFSDFKLRCSISMHQCSPHKCRYENDHRSIWRTFHLPTRGDKMWCRVRCSEHPLRGTSHDPLRCGGARAPESEKHEQQTAIKMQHHQQQSTMWSSIDHWPPVANEKERGEVVTVVAHESSPCAVSEPDQATSVEVPPPGSCTDTTCQGRGRSSSFRGLSPSGWHPGWCLCSSPASSHGQGSCDPSTSHRNGTKDERGVAGRILLLGV